MKTLRTSLIILGMVLLVLGGLALAILEREDILPILPPFLSLVRTPRDGFVPVRGGIAHFWPALGATARYYVNGADWMVRTEWDVDNDGVFDCREDTCNYKSTQRESACVSRRVDGRWVAEPEEVRDCGIPGQRGPVSP
jgi:hypothetical protein